MPNKKTELDKLRHKIDSVDNQIILALSERFDLVKKIGEYKTQNNLPALDKERWEKVLKSKIKQANALGLSAFFTKEVYNLIHKHSLLEEDKIDFNNGDVNKIILHGFRATGKTTISKKIHKFFGKPWQLVEMDQLIEERGNKKINEITQGGTKWQEFRQIEHDLLKELLESNQKMIISTGGGLAVNNITKEGGQKTFGELNKGLLAGQKNTINLILTAKEETVLKWIEEQERAKIGNRPVLNENLAKELQEETKGLDEEDKKELIVKKLLEDSRKIYQQRKPLYESIPGYVVDTSRQPFDKVDQEIIQLILDINKK